MTDPLATILTERLGCRLPVIQTAMGWIATPGLVIASSEAGAFGFLAGAVMQPAELEAAIVAVKAGTKQPFGVNFHMFQPGAAEIVEIILKHRDQIRAVSFGRGPDAKMIGRFKDAGILCVPTVGAVKHAQKMVQLGVDMVTVQGGEGGGHTGSVASTILLPQVLDAVKVPVIAAGGFGDGRGLAAALAYGAVGIAMGTRFLMTRESPIPDLTKARYVKAGTDDILVSTKVDGLPQRMIKNALLDRIERSSGLGIWRRAIDSGLAMKRQTGASFGELFKAAKGMTSHGGLTLPQAMMAASAPMLIQKAVVEGDPDHGLMATGLVAGRLADLPSCAELLAGIEREARARLAALSSSPQTGA
ncbi:2-nitropropane dioxygenase [Sphingopyxis sp. H038]|uniref:NAD(P)H-dependent flavin oxidoreductase n=1 Tax=unclassified Sphingopyxis TaxID=2614943 RepID=UPI0007304FEF|nr:MULTISPECIES: nitronate monooxygenase [unclassified Sphingopyxis]KTE04241.1 2-nitropropane dioxygenase [Sphingopyxis sp. H012]KTE13557.1 2-nitropropane dioxygenase [Sphingopyxis sp. H053]KTE15758.1 2-nitropropane dioxygenase [Sphingopyxis sp. H093]KTE15771.1 2-nitropropane dioxygenase [Sphingopyxis sp. H093]KTE30249.1 2-nitropropane dioxygenase [Sphingopyxis sp. H080]